MSASLFWQPVKGKTIGVGLKSAFIETFCRVFGSLPYTLSQGDLDRLGVAAAVWDEQGANNPFSQLHDALQEHASIRVWAEY